MSEFKTVYRKIVFSTCPQMVPAALVNICLIVPALYLHPHQVKIYQKLLIFIEFWYIWQSFHVILVHLRSHLWNSAIVPALYLNPPLNCTRPKEGFKINSRVLITILRYIWISKSSFLKQLKWTKTTKYILFQALWIENQINDRLLMQKSTQTR